jgi:hypothetical protein
MEEARSSIYSVPYFLLGAWNKLGYDFAPGSLASVFRAVL